MPTTTTVRVCSLSLRTTLTAACLALAALSGCAPVEAVPGSLEGGALTPLVPVSVPAFTHSRGAGFGLTEVAPVVLPPGVQEPRADLRSVSRVEDGLAVGALQRAFDPSGFHEAVARAGEGYEPGVAALPAVEAPSTEDLRVAVFNVVRRSVMDPRAEIGVERPDCGGQGALGCAERFVDAVDGIDGRLAREIQHLARSLGPVAEELQVNLWDATRDGASSHVAVTLHGRYRGALVGIIVFR